MIYESIDFINYIQYLKKHSKMELNIHIYLKNQVFNSYIVRNTQIIVQVFGFQSTLK